MDSAQPNSSSLSINFGERHQPGTPFDLSFILDFFSQEQQNIRNSLSQKYSVQIPATCFAFQFVVQTGTAQAAAERLTKLKEKLGSTQQAPHKATFHHHENKVLILVQAPQYAELLQSKEQYFAELKEDASKEPHPISLRLSSHNSLATIGQKITQQGRLAWFDSLHLDFSFVKTQLITKFLTILFEQIFGIDQFSSIFRSFKQLNFEANFASSEYLKVFPKLKKGQLYETKTKEKNDFSQFLLETGAQQAQFFGFNPTIFLRGDLLVTGLKNLIPIVFV